MNMKRTKRTGHHAAVTAIAPKIRVFVPKIITVRVLLRVPIEVSMDQCFYTDQWLVVFDQCFYTDPIQNDRKQRQLGRVARDALYINSLKVLTLNFIF